MKYMNIIVREPKINDLPLIMILWKEQYEYHNDLDGVYYVAYSDRLEKKFKSYIEKSILKNDPFMKIAVFKNEIVGFVTYEEEDADYFDTKIEKFGVVIELYVKKAWRKKGIGKLLLVWVEKYFREKGLKDMEIQCSSFNVNALSFYKHCKYINRQTFLFKKL